MANQKSYWYLWSDGLQFVVPMIGKVGGSGSHIGDGEGQRNHPSLGQNFMLGHASAERNDAAWVWDSEMECEIW